MRLITALFAILFSCSALATVNNPNPNVTISIISAQSFDVNRPGQTIPGQFAVRLVDPQGNPIQGLTVDFFTNVTGCVPLDPRCTPPPSAMWGHFVDGTQSVLTDTDGVARAGNYVGGTVAGQYNVVGGVYSLGSAKNAEILNGSAGPRAFFAINQFVVASLPASGLLGLLLLAAAIVLLSFGRIARITF